MPAAANQGLLRSINSSSVSEPGKDLEAPDLSKAPKPMENAVDVSVRAVTSILAYSFCSVSMVLANKALAMYYKNSGFITTPDVFMVLLQNVVAVGLVELCKYWKAVDYPAFNSKTAMEWLPVNGFFVAMLITGFMSLRYVHVPMVTIFKNLTNVFIVWGDWYLYQEQVTPLVIASFCCMVLGAVAAAFNDLEFSFLGYFWMMANCLTTAGYMLYMRYVAKTIKLTRFGMVFYNNLLSIALLLPIILVRGEFTVVSDASIWTPQYLILNLFAGCIGFLLNLCSLWCVETNTATTMAIVGSLNKIPLALLGIFLFNNSITFEGAMFISLSMCGGFLYSYAKLSSPKK